LFPYLVPPCERRLETASGASVTVTERQGEERIEVRDAEARLVFAIEPATGRVTLSATSGSLALAAPNGDIELAAGGTVRCRGSAVELDASESARLTSNELRIGAREADVGIAELRYAGDRLRAKLDQAKLTLGRLETVTERLFERAKKVFRQVEDLHQLKAGRLRTMVERSYVLRSGHADIAATDHVKIDGKQIHLG
jgi:hypothetical protein